MNELQIIKIIFKYIFIFLLVFFAIVSISNAYKIKKNLILYGQSCKLPSPLVKKIHTIMKKNATSKILVMGGFLSGLCATFFESLCTGQVYIPSLAYIIKMDIAKIHSFCYIILYNLSCITPLLIIFILIYKGMQFSKIEEFLDNNQFYKNVILAFVFLIIASIMYIL